MDTIHMAETTSPRLMAAAKEFNIGKETLVDFLVGKGFSKDDLKPTAKLTEDMYRSLQQEFQGDKVAKIKSNQIDLPKGSVEAKRKKEDETVLFRKGPEKKPVKEEPAPVVVEEVKPVVVAKVEEPVRKEPETIKIEAPEIEGPKIIDKIDLSLIDSSTRPKKGFKKEDVPENEPEVVAEVITPPVQPENTIAEPPPPVKTPPPTKVKEEAPVREEPVEQPVIEETPEPVVIKEDEPAEEPSVTTESEIPPVIENIR